jgi:hypothetical protein
VLDELSAGFEILKHHFPRDHWFFCSISVLPRHYTVLKNKTYVKKRPLQTISPVYT